MKDAFYTPTALADRLANFVTRKDIKTVADFSIGDGELLRAAVQKWPKVICYGTDISQKTISFVKASHPDWNLGKCDFLNGKSRKHSTILEKKGGYDLILLNPPFSCIGGSRHYVEFEGKNFEVSTAMAFLTTSLAYLSKNGCIYAILPNSVAYSQKDSSIWKALVNKYNLTILEESDTQHFSDCSARIIIVSVNAVSSSKINTKKKVLKHSINDLSVFRGKMGMHKVDQNLRVGKYFIHSTNLRNHTLVNLKIKLKNKLSEVNGPAVLIPRVGLPNKSKICKISRNQSFVISDCILAIKTKTESDSSCLEEILVDNWKDLNDLYKGTGARYTTLERVQEFLGLK